MLPLIKQRLAEKKQSKTQAPSQGSDSEILDQEESGTHSKDTHQDNNNTFDMKTQDTQPYGNSVGYPHKIIEMTPQSIRSFDRTPQYKGQPQRFIKIRQDKIDPSIKKGMSPTSRVNSELKSQLKPSEFVRQPSPAFEDQHLPKIKVLGKKKQRPDDQQLEFTESRESIQYQKAAKRMKELDDEKLVGNLQNMNIQLQSFQRGNNRTVIDSGSDSATSPSAAQFQASRAEIFKDKNFEMQHSSRNFIEYKISNLEDMINDDFIHNQQSKALFLSKQSNQSTAVHSGALAATGALNLTNKLAVTSGYGVTSPINFKMTSPFGSRFFQDANFPSKLSPAATQSKEIDRQIKQQMAATHSSQTPSNFSTTDKDQQSQIFNQNIHNIKNLNKATFFYSPSMKKSFLSKQEAVGKRHTILDAKIGSNYLQAKKMSIQNSQAMIGLEFITPTARKKLPIGVNAFTLGQRAYNSKLTNTDSKTNQRQLLEDRASSKKRTNLSLAASQILDTAPDIGGDQMKIVEPQASGSEDEDQYESSDETIDDNVLMIKEEEIEEGVLSPRDVKVNPKIKVKLHEYKKSAGEQWQKEDHKKMIKILQYLSPECKYTGDREQLEQQVSAYCRGFKPYYLLEQDLDQLKHQYDIGVKEEFSKHYNDDYVYNPDPLNNNEHLFFQGTIQEILKYTDNVIYFKKKMVREGKRKKETKLVYINKESKQFLDDTYRKTKLPSYTLTRFYQNQPHLCEVAKLGSRLLLKIYQDDKRFIIDPGEELRLDLDNMDVGKYCNQHGLGNDAEREQRRQAFNKTNAFYETLIKHTNKVALDKQVSNLVDLIKTSMEPEFKTLRLELRDQSKERNMNFEQMRKLYPLIFLKDKRPEAADAFIDAKDTEKMNLNLARILKEAKKSNEFALRPEERILINQKIVETFVKSIKQGLSEETVSNTDEVTTHVSETGEKFFPAVSEDAVSVNLQPEAQKQTGAVEQEGHQSQLSQIQAPQETTQPTQEQQPTGVEQTRIHLDDDKPATELLNEQFQKAKFFALQKLESQNPLGVTTAETTFIHNIRKKIPHPTFPMVESGIPEPLFAKIQDGQLNISGQPMESQTVKALSNYIREKTQELYSESKLIQKQFQVRDLILDNCNLTDSDFANILNGLSIQDSLTAVTYVKNRFGLESLQALKSLLEKPFPNNTLESFTFKDLKADKYIIEKLTQLLDECPILKKIKFHELDLNLQATQLYIQRQFTINPNLIEFDITKCRIYPQDFMEMMRVLAFNANTLQIQYLNLSYVSLYNNQQLRHNAKKKDYEQEFIQLIGQYLQNTIKLKHLDLSGMNLKGNVKALLEFIKVKSLRRGSKLVGIHLNDNEIPQEVKDFFLKKLQIETKQMHKVGELDQDQVKYTALSVIQTKHKNLFQIAKRILAQESQAADDVDVVKNDMTKKVKADQNLQQRDYQAGFGRTEHINDTFILTRKIGHAELIFNESQFLPDQEFSTVNNEEQWQMHMMPLQTSTQSGYICPCYVCQKWCYVQVFLDEKHLSRDFEKIEDPSIISELKKAFNLNQERYQTGSPIFLSSMNDWVISRFIDIQLYCQLIKSQDTKYSIQHIKDSRRTVRELHQSRNYKKEQYREDCNVQVDINGDFPVIADDIQNAHFLKKDIAKVELCNENIIKGLKGQSLKVYSRILGVEQPKATDKTGSFVDSMIQDKQEDKDAIFDEFTSYGWRDILDQLDIPEDDLIQLNFPSSMNYGKRPRNNLSIYAQYARPGRHTILVYLPKSKEFYKREVFIRARKHELEIQDWPIKASQMNKDMEEPQKQFGLKLEQAGEMEQELDVIDDDSFMFKDWFFETSENISKLFKSDFINKSLNFPVVSKIDKSIFGTEVLTWKFRILEHIQENFRLFLNCHKLYLSYYCKQNDPGHISTMFKYIDFLLELNLVTKTLQSPIKIPIDQLQTLGIIPDLKNIEEQIVYRNEFILNLYLVCFGQYFNKISQASKKTGESTKINIDKFLGYFELNVLKKIKADFMSTFEHNQIESFRRDFIWKVKLNKLFMDNAPYLRMVFDWVKKKASSKALEKVFNLQSAIDLIELANIKFDRVPTIPQEDFITRLFMISQQYVVDETNLIQYQTLEFTEFLEFIARVAHEVYHYSFASSDERTVKEQIMGSQAFDLKVFLLMQENLLPIVGREVSIQGKGPVIDEKKFLKKKKAAAKKASKMAGSRLSGQSPEVALPELDESILQFSDDEDEINP